MANTTTEPRADGSLDAAAFFADGEESTAVPLTDDVDASEGFLRTGAGVDTTRPEKALASMVEKEKVKRGGGGERAKELGFARTRSKTFKGKKNRPLFPPLRKGKEKRAGAPFAASSPFLHALSRIHHTMASTAAAQPLALPATGGAPPPSVRIDPAVLLSIADAHGRRPADGGADRVIGTLLGSFAPDGAVDVRDCFTVPHSETAEQVRVEGREGEGELR